MRIYSNVISGTQLVKTAHKARIHLEIETIRKPKLAKRGWIVQTSGYSKRWKNSGTYGASSDNAASWDDHGKWFNLLYNIDPNTIVIGTRRYNNAQDFHAQTDNKYRTTPEVQNREAAN